MCCGLWVLAGASGATPRPNLERVREAIAIGRERIERYQREELGLFEALEAMESAVALLAAHVREVAVRADEAGAAARRADAERRQVEERLRITERAMGERAAAEAAGLRAQMREARVRGPPSKLSGGPPAPG